MKLSTTSISLLLLLMVNGCGFSLRGNSELPSGINAMRLSATEPHSALKRILQKRLKPHAVQLIGPSAARTEETLSLHIVADSLDRRLLSLFPTGQVAEYELIYSVSYQLQFPAEDAQLIQFEIRRDYQDDPDAVLAKSRELELVLAEMRQQAADRMIRHISVTHAKVAKFEASNY
ncbi:MAG: LPS-assembly lipoprotein [Paraglaciecola sp.]|jgi:LPS-assembly lipoprotein